MKYTVKNMGEDDYLIRASTPKGLVSFCRIQASKQHVNKVAEMLTAYGDLRAALEATIPMLTIAAHAARKADDFETAQRHSDTAEAARVALIATWRNAE